jgi:hypothetical protein
MRRDPGGEFVLFFHSQKAVDSNVLAALPTAMWGVDVTCRHAEVVVEHGCPFYSSNTRGRHGLTPFWPVPSGSAVIERGEGDAAYRAVFSTPHA